MDGKKIFEMLQHNLLCVGYAVLQCLEMFGKVGIRIIESKNILIDIHDILKTRDKSVE